MATKTKSIEDAKNKQSRVNDWQQAIAREYTYCMFSTLNQMVNYLPMLLFNFQKSKMYVTLEGDEQNRTFDKNLNDTLSKLPRESRFSMPDKFIEIGDVNDVSNIQKVLSNEANGKKVIWNITGGQRPFVMAVFELLKEEARKDDLVMYLEGNRGQLTFLRVTENKTLEKIPASEHGMGQCHIKGVGEERLIPIALQLMGFTPIKSTKNNNSYNPFSPSRSKSDFYQHFIEKYLEDKNLREDLLRLNKENEKKDEEKKVADILKKHLENGMEEFKKYTYQTVGSFLENLFAHKIWSVAKEHIAEMAVNLELDYDNETEEKGTKDELDIIVLTRTGQLVVFEVKSGGMSGDVAKSTKYTTYAIAGVYGKPVLLTPLLNKHLKSLEELSKDNDSVYKSAAKAARAARHAQLPILALDGNEDGDFEEALKKIFGIL